MSDVKDIDGELFEVMIGLTAPSISFTYALLKDDIDECIKKVKEIADEHINTVPEDYEELKVLMKRFMRDMEQDLQKGNKMKKDKIHLLKLKFIRIMKNEPPCDYCKYRCVYKYCSHYAFVKNRG